MTGVNRVSEPVTPSHPGSDGTWRWLVGGLAFGGVILGLLAAAYAIGYRNGQHQALPAAPPAPATGPVATTGAATTAPSPIGPVPVTAALVAQGKSLYQADGCSACHSLSGSAGVGPGFEGLAGSTVTLDDGQTVTADDDYLQRSILDPDAEIVKGFRAGLMAPAIAGFDLAKKPNDVRALIAFVKSRR